MSVSSGAETGARFDAGPNAAERPFEVRPPRPDEALSTITRNARRRLSLEYLTMAVVAALAAAWIGIGSIEPLARYTELLFGRQNPRDTQVVVERIIRAESSGNSILKNPRSTATGSGQFINQTWLEMIKVHRSDLLPGRSDEDVLALRIDPALSREIVTRMVERNTAMLRKRGLPVTPATLYLAHFAGPAGAVAVLTVADETDAASVLARADSTGKTTREKLVKANPFLEKYTVGDLKSWANRKMRG